MKSCKMVLISVMVLFGTMVTGSALAYGGHDHSRVRFSVFIGAPAFWYYPPPVYYYPPVVAVPASPPVYIERGNAQAAPEQSRAYWYYCADEKAYYPYVKQCPGGWQRVAPQPPPG